jgi:uncharacterized repeat protein (TIGR01451 family)
MFLVFAAFLTPAAALAAEDVTINSAAFVERTVQDASGKPKTLLEAPKVVTPGDRVVFVLSYRNGGAHPATGFVINNPLPAAVTYESSEGMQPVVSVDGGKTWGPLAALKITQEDGTMRPATPADVTHPALDLPGDRAGPGRQTELPRRRQITPRTPHGCLRVGNGIAKRDEWGIIMTRNMRLFASASVLAVAALGAPPALAAGTASGTTITNNVSVAFKVGGIDQTASTASNDFTVDRKIIFTVAEDGSATTAVTPGSTASVTTFVVTNTSNTTLDFSLTATQITTGSSGAHSNTDGYDVTNLAVYADTNGNNTYDAGDTRTFVDELAPDTSVRVFIIGDTPLGTANGGVAAVRLAASAREGGSGGSQGLALSQDNGANQEDVVDTVFADTGRDNSENALDDYTVAAANLTVVKTSTVISDPINTTTNPKMIPGALVEYCITVANAAGAATATNITISDTLPTDTTYVNNSIYVDGDASCANGSLGGSQAAGVVTAPLSNIAGGATRSTRFRVTVN